MMKPLIFQAKMCLTHKALRVAILLTAVACTCAASQAQTVYKVAVGTKEAISPNLYGVNGQNRNGDAWDQISTSTPFTAALGSLNLGILRFPAGTGANYWNQSGTGDYNGYFITSPSNYQSPLTELNKELVSAGTQVKVDYVLNVLTDSTQCPVSSGAPANCAVPVPTPSSPNLTAQTSILSNEINKGIYIPYVELGNEFWITDANGYNADVYPDTMGGQGSYQYDFAGRLYAKLLTNGNWISSIQAADTGVKIAAVANYINGSGPSRSKTWNQSFFSSSILQPSALPAVDALVLHVYVPTNLSALTGVTPTQPFNGSGAGSNATATMLAAPFHTQDDIAANYLNEATYNNCGSSGASGTMNQLQISGFEPDIWVTEYNLRDAAYATFGTWAHGLFTATMSLKFLENLRASNTSARITMANVHDTYGGAQFGEIFDSTTGYTGSGTVSPVPLDPANLDTTADTLTAAGMVEQQINLAAAGQTGAQPLTFLNGSTAPPSITDPTVSGYTYPSIYGYQFSGSGTTYLVILNLSNSPQTIDLSGVLQHGYYWQEFGDPGAYVLGYTNGNSSAPARYINPSNHTQSDPITVTNDSTVTPSSLILPAYSITRIKRTTS